MSGDDSDLTRRALAWVGGAVAALVGVALFVRFVFLDLSVTGRAASFAVAAVVSLAVAATLPVQEEAGLLAAVCVVAFAGYTAIAFELDGTLAAGLAVGSLAALFTLTVAIQNRRLSLQTRTGAVVVVVVLAALAGVVAVDMQPNEVSYTVSLDDSVRGATGNADSYREVTIGSVTVRNPSEYLREQVEYPDARACVYTGVGNGTERAVTYRFASSFAYDTVGPESTSSAEMTVLLSPGELTTFDSGTPIRRAASCPESSAEPQILVVVGNESG